MCISAYISPQPSLCNANRLARRSGHASRRGSRARHATVQHPSSASWLFARWWKPPLIHTAWRMPGGRVAVALQNSRFASPALPRIAQQYMHVSVHIWMFSYLERVRGAGGSHQFTRISSHLARNVSSLVEHLTFDWADEPRIPQAHNSNKEPLRQSPQHDRQIKHRSTHNCAREWQAR